MQATYPAVVTDENFAREVEKHEAQMKLASLEGQIQYSRNETHRYELRTRLLEAERLEVIENLRILAHKVM